MADYWKSNAKKFCLICKTWYADNKISSENHERGLKHKSMIQQRLRESTKKAQEKERQQEELQNTLRQMEYAALASMSNDERKKIAQKPSSMKNVGSKLPSKKDVERMEFRAQKRKLEQLRCTGANSEFWDNNGQIAVHDSDSAQDEIKPFTFEKEWVQALQNETGEIYYWHIFSGETKWDVPYDGKFFTMEEYNQRYAEISAHTATNAYFSAPSGSQTYSPKSANVSSYIKHEEEANFYETKKPKNNDDSSTKKKSRWTVDDDLKTKSDLGLKRHDLNKEQKNCPVKIKLESKQDNGNPNTVLLTEMKDGVPIEFNNNNNVVKNVTEKPKNVPVLGAWVPVIKTKNELIKDLPSQSDSEAIAAEKIEEMKLGAGELSFPDKVLAESKKKPSKTMEFKKRSFSNKGNLRSRVN